MGGLKIFRPRRSPAGTKSDGGGDLQKNPTEAKTAYLIIMIIIIKIYKAPNTKVSKRYTNDTRKLKIQLSTLHLKLQHDKRYN